MRRPTHLRACSTHTQHLAALVCALLWVGVGLAGCSFDARDCTLDSPCPSDHVCDSATGICEPLDLDGSSRSDAHQPDADAGSDSSHRFDAPPDDPDAPQPHDSGPLGGECLVDPFSYSCSQDSHEPNNDDLNSTGLSSDSIGCGGPSGELVGFDADRRATICPDDQDWYGYSVWTCPSRSFIVEVYVMPDKACDPRSYAMEWRVEDDLMARCVDPERDGTPKWQCQALEGGGKKLAYIVDSERFEGNETHEITVLESELADDQAVQFDYTIRVRLKP